MSYLEEHNSCGIKVGDKVKVIRVAKNYENGWDNVWNNYSKISGKTMDNFVNEIHIVTYDHIELGFELDHAWTFPYFVLEKIYQEEKTMVRFDACPKCKGELKEKYSEWSGGNIKKCSNCGWC